MSRVVNGVSQLLHESNTESVLARVIRLQQLFRWGTSIQEGPKQWHEESVRRVPTLIGGVARLTRPIPGVGRVVGWWRDARAIPGVDGITAGVTRSSSATRWKLSEF